MKLEVTMLYWKSIIYLYQLRGFPYTLWNIIFLNIVTLHERMPFTCLGIPLLGTCHGRVCYLASQLLVAGTGVLIR